MSEAGPYRYRALVLDQLWRHGIQPTDRTRPELVREFVRDLYKYEIRRLRDQMIRKEFPKTEYAGRVDRLRQGYTVLSLLPRQLLE